MTMRREHEGSTGAPEPDSQQVLPEVELWLVDGFNALHAVVLGGESRAAFWGRAQRERLIERLSTPAPSMADDASDRFVPILLVFDGKRPVEAAEAHPAPHLELVFAASADDWIVKRARRESREARPRRVGVVTRDRQVAGRCQHAGALIVAPGPFLACFPEPKPAQPRDRDEPGA